MSEIVPVAECRISDVTRHSQDERVIQMWIHGRSAHTQDAYTRDIQRFLQFVDGKPLSSVTLEDLQAFADALAQENLAPATRHRRLSAVKSLLAFAHRIGYLPFDVGRPLRLPPRKNTLPERILTENETHRMIALEPNRRNRALLMLLYGAGLRVAEACNLRWRDLQARADGGQVTVFGKGGKTRTVLLPRAVWQELTAIRNGAEPDAPVFVSRKRCALTTRQAERIVRQAAQRAGIQRAVSPHWLRHAHASHALERGATVALVAQTLGHANIATTGKYLHARPQDSSSRYLPL